MNWAIELARTYRPEKGQANLFGVVVFTDSHPHIKKMLNDEDYWRALDELSGPRWVIFATRAAAGNWYVPPPPPDSLGLMRMVWQEPRENRKLLSAFALDSTSDLPILVIFAEGSDGEVRSTWVKLQDTSEKEAFESLREVLVRIASALDIVLEENRCLDTRAFNAVSYALKDYREWNALRHGIAIWQWFRSLC